MKKYMLLIIGIILLAVSFIWMVISQSSTGMFLILGGASGRIIVEGIFRIKKEKNNACTQTIL